MVFRHPDRCKLYNNTIIIILVLTIIVMTFAPAAAPAPAPGLTFVLLLVSLCNVAFLTQNLSLTVAARTCPMWSDNVGWGRF